MVRGYTGAWNESGTDLSWTTATHSDLPPSTQARAREEIHQTIFFRGHCGDRYRRANCLGFLVLGERRYDPWLRLASSGMVGSWGNKQQARLPHIGGDCCLGERRASGQGPSHWRRHSRHVDWSARGLL